MSSWECVVVFSEIPAWAYDRTVWLRFTMLLRVWTHTCRDTHSATQTRTRASCLCFWLFVVDAPGVKLLSVWLCPLQPLAEGDTALLLPWWEGLIQPQPSCSSESMEAVSSDITMSCQLPLLINLTCYRDWKRVTDWLRKREGDITNVTDLPHMNSKTKRQKSTMELIVFSAPVFL